MQSRFKPLENEYAVISLGSILIKVKTLMSLIRDGINGAGMSQVRDRCSKNGHGSLPDYGPPWVNEEGVGIDCEVLNPSSTGWQKGRIRLKLTLEFCPDEPESNPLDELRS